MRDVTTIAIFCLLAAITGSVVAATADDPQALDTERAWERAAAAREAAGRDDHDEAGEAFIAALLHDGRLVAAVGDELAYQKLWNEDHDRAIFHFRRYLARHPDERNRDVRLGLALAYSWSGRQDEAARVYRQLLAEDPDDLDARLGLGRALVWDNRLHEGYGVLHGLETDHHDTDQARSARGFLLTVLDGYDTHLDAIWEGIWDSDDLTIHRFTAKGRSNLGSVLLEAGLGTAFYAQPDHPDVTAPRVQLGVVAPLAHNWALHAYGWLDRFTSDGPLPQSGAELEWTRPGGDAWLTWLPAPRWRLDLGAGSQVVETYDAFAQHLHHEPVSLSADWRFARHWTLSGTGQLAWYSDDNRRRRGALRLDWHHDGAWSWSLGPVLSYMDFEIPYPGGYWAPDWVRNASLAARLKHDWSHFTAQIDGSYGLEKELGADAIAVGGGHGHVGWRFADGWLLGADLSHSRSRFTSDSGYNRTAAAVRVRAVF